MSTPQVILWENIPPLADNGFLVYKLEPREGQKPAKVPYDFRTGRMANNPKFGATRAEVQLALSNGHGYTGPGYFVERPYVVIDIDNCLDPKTGDIEPWAADIIKEINSYSEASPSMTGVHIWILGEKPGDKCRKGIEIYSTKRFLTLTGIHVPGTPKTIEKRDITGIYNRMLSGEFEKSLTQSIESVLGDDVEPVKPSPAKSTSNVAPATSLLHTLMTGSVTGSKPFTVDDGLGNVETYPSHSEADAALCLCLARKHGTDPVKIDEEFRKSNLLRDKWEKREDYRKATINSAIALLPAATSAVAQSSAQVSPSFDEDDDAPFDPLKVYDMTPEEIAAQDEAEYPVYKLKETAGPQLEEDGLYGPMAEVAKKICKFSEAHVVTVYLNLIVTLGNMFGRGPYFHVDGTKHYTNENLANIGETSKARKGTSSDAAEAFLRVVDLHYMNTRNMGGFGSSQAVIELVKDTTSFKKRGKDGVNVTGVYRTIIVQGVEDKRLLIRESELSNLFKLLSDPKSRAAELFRNAFDGKPISNLVAGKTDDGEHRSLTCKEPMISVIGSSTQSLVKQTMPFGADTSGDGNRFLWNLVKPTQDSPFGGPQIVWADETIEFEGATIPLLVYVNEMIAEARDPQQIPLTLAGNKFWHHQYLRLKNNHRSGFLGGMTSREAAHIRRLAMILCLIDRELKVDVKHLKAAEAIWNYSCECARFIFIGYSLDQRRILKLASEKNEGITLTEIHGLFKRNKSAEWIRVQVRTLVDGGFLTVANDVYKFKKW